MKIEERKQTNEQNLQRNNSDSEKNKEDNIPCLNRGNVWKGKWRNKQVAKLEE